MLGINDSNAATTYNNRGLAWLGAAQFEKAVADFDKALSLNPKDVLAYNNRGVARQDSGDYEKAIIDFEQALKLDPDFALAHNNLAYLLATCSDEKCRDSRKAIDNATKAVHTSLTERKKLGLHRHARAGVCRQRRLRERQDLAGKSRRISARGKKGSKQDAALRLELYKQGKP